MTTKLKSADIVIVGLGWTGGILAKELADTGLSIVVLERGAPRDTNPDFMYPTVHDELRYAQRHELMQNVSRETLTFRNTASETALPMRQLGSFLPGEGVGGAGVHWNGATWRWLPWDHEPLKLTLAHYGRPAIPPDMNLQDWGSPTTSSSPTTTSSSFCAASRARPAICAAKRSRAGTCLRDRGSGSTPTRR
jgi:gluconate 2-dehydrogenase alpha chain